MEVRNHAEALLSIDHLDDASNLFNEEQLRNALTPSYSWLFGLIGRRNGGVKFLADLRGDLLAYIPHCCVDINLSARLRAMATSLRDVLSQWFHVGLLKVERVTWQSGCDILQKVSEYESVHPMRNWTDLKRRVGLFRRCFVFTHSSMPREPIVVLHVALTNEISSSIQKILTQNQKGSSNDSSESSEDDEVNVSTAIFYSISSTQVGLQGIELGTYLIKSVVKELRNEFPDMDKFSSLSPIPGFSSWLSSQIHKAMRVSNTVLSQAEIKALQTHLKLENKDELWKTLLKLLNTNQWIKDDKIVDILEIPLMRLCAFYLFSEKRRGLALDNVANFHLRNGAVMWRLNWRADLTPRGVGNSCGIMVNYRYYLEECEENSRKYLEECFIKSTDQIKQLVELHREVIAQQAIEKSQNVFQKALEKSQAMIDSMEKNNGNNKK